MVFDAYELCTESLQARLLPMRAKFKADDDRIAEAKKGLSVKGGSITQSEAGKDLPADAFEPTQFPEDEGSNNSGFYELVAVLTHQGRSSSSGHYMAWVRHKGKVWLKFDDEDVAEVLEEDVLRLSGGGDWHSAYVLVYGPRKLRKHEPTEAEAMDTTAAALTSSNQ